MFEDELKLLLEKEWTEEEKTLITNLISTVTYFKRMLPKNFKQDILCALQMCNSLKIELDLYRKKCKCTFSKNVAISKGCLNYKLNIGFIRPNIYIDFITYMEFKNKF